MEQPGHEPAPMWDGGAACRGLTHHATTVAALPSSLLSVQVFTSYNNIATCVNRQVQLLHTLQGPLFHNKSQQYKYIKEQIQRGKSTCCLLPTPATTSRAGRGMSCRNSGCCLSGCSTVGSSKREQGRLGTQTCLAHTLYLQCGGPSCPP